MRKLIAIVMLVGLVGLSAPASANEYTIGFFADESASSCEIYNTTQEVSTIHMILFGSASTANTIQFYAPTPDCWTGAVWLGDEIADPFLFLGNSRHEGFGLTITFTECRSLPLRLGSMSFWAAGSEPCCTYRAYAAASVRSGNIETIDCSSNVFETAQESVIINPDASCSCTASSLVATEPTTWGKVKALYR